MYCNRVFTVINASIPATNKVLANRATQIYGLAGFFAIIMSPLVVSKFKKRITMLSVGQLGITFSLFGLAYSIEHL